MLIPKAAFALTALLLGAAVHAEPGTVTRLTPEQIAAIQAEAEAAGSAAEGAEAEPGRDRIHGEVGVSIGSGGAREISGAINTPLGANGQATISGDARRWPRPPIVRNADRR